MRFSRRRFVRAGALAGVAAALPSLSGCRRPNGDGVALEKGGLSKFTMQAAWVNDAEFMGYFIALELGLYQAEGLDLTYLPGGPEVIPEGTLLSGRADLALTTPDTTVNLILKEGAPLKIIGTQYQKSPLGVVSLAESGIEKPSDLVGRTLAVPPVNVLSVEAMLRLNDIDEGAVRIVPYQYDPTPLLNGDVDATIDFTTNVPFTIEQSGAKAHHFLLYDHGFTIYNDTVVVREETLRTRRRDLVAWLRASRAGWDENLLDTKKWPSQFADTWFQGTGRTIANEEYFNEAQRPLIEHPAGVFAMTEEDIAKNIEALDSIGLKAKPDIFVRDLLAEV